jgi:cytochrome c-type biogenesis protein
MERNRVIILMLFGILLGMVIVLGLKGWTGFIAPNLGRMAEFPLPILLGFSFLAGIASFFAPCAFTLFPGYVAFYLGIDEKRREHPIKIGFIAATGMLSFFILLSIVLIIIGRGIIPYLHYIAPSIGFIIIIAGVLLFQGYTFKTAMIKKGIDNLRSEDVRSRRNIYLFGFGYGAVSIGCTLPLLFAMIIVPLTTGKITTVMLSLLFYFIAMSILIISITYLVAWSKNKLIIRMLDSTIKIKKASGIVLVVVGAFLIYYNIFYSMLH